MSSHMDDEGDAVDSIERTNSADYARKLDCHRHRLLGQNQGARHVGAAITVCDVRTEYNGTSTWNLHPSRNRTGTVR